MQGGAERPLRSEMIEEGPRLTPHCFVTLLIVISELPFEDAILAIAHFETKDWRGLLVGLAIA